ncbi:MAG: magnesium transporter [Pseudomonadota bacterium]|nr:magnesium transporter [Pseudomonadota bacterium]MDP1904558.1 magnesium transporter [Pseudomonadota bacterium]MDP2353243.1 magnesium transporter [Pseudomonadota bacterium]
MSDQHELPAQMPVEDSLKQVKNLLARHRLVEGLVHKQEMPRHDLVESLVHKQHLVELQKRLDKLHPADVAYILEALPLEDRLLVWSLVKADRDGDILLEVSDAVRESLIATMDIRELVAAAASLDTDEIADLAMDLPKDVVQELMKSLDNAKRAQVESSLSYDEDSVGGLMDYDFVTIRADVTLEVALRYLRRLGELPSHSDKLFVVDRNEHLIGTLPLKRMLVHDPDVHVAAIMSDDPVSFNPSDPATEAAQAFERYDLVTAPVVDARGNLVGRLTVDVVLDFIRAEAEEDMLQAAGLREEEDLFSTVWKAAKNRWLWLAINLCTALFASRVVGAFEGSIEKLAALAALMPIVAGMGGNSGSQTLTLMVRGLALGLISRENTKRLLIKEFGIAILNGVMWGSIMGLVTWLLYDNPALALVMAAAMLMSLIVAALAGFVAPIIIVRLGHDPAFGAHVLLTFITDSMGFLIFLGLATLVLL